MPASSSSAAAGAVAVQTARSRSTTVDELALKQNASQQVRDYADVRILEQLVDQQGIVVEETLLVVRVSNPAQRYALRIVELRNESTLRAIFHEINILKKLELHDNIMGLFVAFRHRQYVGLLQPAFGALRDKVDLLHRYRKSNGQTALLFRDPLLERRWNEDTSKSRGREFLQQVGVFGREAVLYVLRRVLAGLEYLNSKFFVHTQICASSVFVDDQCSIKLGAFLHARRLQSTRWNFTGNPSRLPPEAFVKQTQQQVKPTIDTWGIGLFVLEMITGKRLRYTRDEMRSLAEEFLNGTQMPPTLAETEPSTVQNGKQKYDKYIDSFLEACFTVDPAKRPNPSKLLDHPFVSGHVNVNKARINIGVEPLNDVEWNVKRSLRLEMLAVHTHYGQLKEQDLMLQILNAIKLIRDGTCVPIFGERLEDVRNYVAVDSSLAFQHGEDENWSRDVLNISGESQLSSEPRRRQQTNKIPHKSGEQIRGHSRFPQEKRENQRCEMVFFVHRKWSRDNRQLFVALQFARWFDRGLIGFPDLVRIVDELDDILIDHLLSAEPRPFSPYKPAARTSPPDSVAFISGLHKSLFDPEANNDPDTHKFNNIYVEVALSGKLLQKKLTKFNHLREGDPVELPEKIGPLSASATYYDLNMKRLDLMEALLMGERRLRDWDFDPEQRFADAGDPRTQLTTLLKERRRNPNVNVDSSIDWEASNQARRAKIWGDFTRDFMYRFARYHVPYQFSEKAAAKVWGTPGTMMDSSSEESTIEPLSPASGDDTNRMDALQLQLMRTRAKQEQDVVEPSKMHDDVEMRREAVLRQLERDNQSKDEQLRELAAQLESLQARFREAQPDSPAPPPTEEHRDTLSRRPKYNR